MPELTDLSVIRALCEKYDFALSKGFGQNFIINPGLPPKIVDASGVDKRLSLIHICTPTASSAPRLPASSIWVPPAAMWATTPTSS